MYRDHPGMCRQVRCILTVLRLYLERELSRSKQSILTNNLGDTGKYMTK